MVKRAVFCMLPAILAASLMAAPRADKMVRVPGGTFTMGYNSEDPWSMDGPAHEVTVDGFMISACEITQAQWTSVMGTNPSLNVGDSLPVERVRWSQALDYCNRRSELEGLQPCYSFSFDDARIVCDWTADGYRLPTEAEWEFAARGGKRGKGFWYSGSDNIDEVGWYADNSEGETHPVGTLRANELGLYDMTGNVWEFCWDGSWYMYTEDAVTNPRDEWQHFEGNYRGGGYTNPPEECHNAFRGFGLSRKHNIGFRVVRALP